MEYTIWKYMYYNNYLKTISVNMKFKLLYTQQNVIVCSFSEVYIYTVFNSLNAGLK